MAMFDQAPEAGTDFAYPGSGRTEKVDWSCRSQHRRRKMNAFAESFRREVFGAITRKLTTIVSNA
jgi:hypothetical protein